MSGRSRSRNGGSTSRFDPIYTESRRPRRREGGSSGGGDSDDDGGDGRHTLDERDFVRVSHRDHVVRLAGKIAWNARRDQHMPLLASGPPALATALGAISKAREFLGEDKEPLELLCQPAFRNKEMGASLAFFLSAEDSRRRDFEDSSARFTTSKNSKVSTLAGAIAGRARDGVGALVEAIGDEAVATAAMAMAKARIFLEDDKLDLRFVTKLEEIEKTGADGVTRTLTTFRLRAYLEDV